jgi:hypothetical protein
MEKHFSSPLQKYHLYLELTYFSDYKPGEQREEKKKPFTRKENRRKAGT